MQTLLSGRGRGEPRSATAMSTAPCKVRDLTQEYLSLRCTLHSSLGILQRVPAQRCRLVTSKRSLPPHEMLTGCYCLIGILTDLIFQRELATRTPVVVFDGWQGPAASLATAGCGRLPPLPHQAARLLYYACMTMGQPPPTFSPPMRGCLEYASRPLRRSLTLPLPTHAILPAVLSALHLQGRRPGGDGAPQQTWHAPDRQPARQPCGSGRRLVRGERGADIRPQNYPLFAH